MGEVFGLELAGVAAAVGYGVRCKGRGVFNGNAVGRGAGVDLASDLLLTARDMNMPTRKVALQTLKHKHATTKPEISAIQPFLRI